MISSGAMSSPVGEARPRLSSNAYAPTYRLAMSPTWAITRSGMPTGASSSNSHSVTRAIVGPDGTRPSVMRALSRWRWAEARNWRPMSLSWSRHRAGSGSGSSISSASRSERSWSSSSLLRTCQYSEPAPVPSSWATRCIDSPSRPSRSRTRSAASTIASRVSGARGSARTRASRRHGGCGIPSFALTSEASVPERCSSLERRLTTGRPRARMTFEKWNDIQGDRSCR